MSVIKFLLIFTVLTGACFSDEIDELDALLDKEVKLEEEAIDLSMESGPITNEKSKEEADEFKIYRKNQDIQFAFKGVKKNLIRWNELNPSGWLDLSLWKKSRVRKDQEPEWKLNLIERNLRELVGRFLSCVGDCRIYRGEGFSTSRFKSRVRELDEIITLPDSYAWIVLVDGTLIRLSPNTSLSFKEINIGKKELFVHLRINSGNVLVLNREQLAYKESPLRETDKIFLPLGLNKANPEEHSIKLDESDLSNFIETENKILKQYKKLNESIASNNEMIGDKKTHTMVVMPNGTVYGKSIQAEFVVLLGGESFVKQRSYKEQNFNLSDEAAEETKAEFFYRGFENRESLVIEPGTWYRIGAKGRSIVPHDNPQMFHIGEYLTSNIPSILLAREILIEEKSNFLFEPEIDRKDLALSGGYRLWGEIDKKGDDLNLRLRFLKEYTRRVETTNLVVAQQFRRKAAARGELTKSMVYDRSFYERALQDYIVTRESDVIVDTDREVLNSTKKPFWKIINGKSNR